MDVVIFMVYIYTYMYIWATDCYILYIFGVFFCNCRRHASASFEES